MSDTNDATPESRDASKLAVMRRTLTRVQGERDALKEAAGQALAALVQYGKEQYLSEAGYDWHEDPIRTLRAAIGKVKP